MVGNPGESEKTVQDTLNFLNSVPMTDSPSTSILYILPGTLLYESLKRDGYIREEDWYRYDTVPFYTLENSYRSMTKWVRMINSSGNKIVFDLQKHFWHGIQETADLKIDTKINAAIKNLVKIVTQPGRVMSRTKKFLPAGRIRF
jgi:hypothetical protein